MPSTKEKAPKKEKKSSGKDKKSSSSGSSKDKHAVAELPHVDPDEGRVLSSEDSIARKERELREREEKLRAKIAAKKAQKEPPKNDEGEEGGGEEVDAKPAADDQSSKPAPPPPSRESKPEEKKAEPAHVEGQEGNEDAENEDPENSAAADPEGGEEIVLEYPNNYYDADGNFVGNADVIQWATSLYDYEATSSEEISFKAGELIGILEHDNDGWMRGDYYGYIGSFPTSYVQLEANDSEQVQTRQRAATERTLVRRAERDDLKAEMRDVKAKLDSTEEKVEALQKEIKDLSEQRAELQNRLRKQRANASDEASMLLDLLKLAFDMDVEHDAYIAAVKAREAVLAEFSECASELAKEVKTSPGVGIYSQNMTSKLGSVRPAQQSVKLARDQSAQKAAIFRRDLEVVLKGVATTSGKKK